MNLKLTVQKKQYVQWCWDCACKNNSIYSEYEADGAKAIVFTMMWKLWVQKQQYLQWIWSRRCKNHCIYHNFEAAGAKTILFTMILKLWVQKPVFIMNLKLPVHKPHYLHCSWSCECKNTSIYSEFEAVDAKNIVYTMISMTCVTRRQHYHWFNIRSCIPHWIKHHL